MRRERRYLGLAIILAVPMSQLGHLFAYALQGLPSDGGVHAYFPNLLAALTGATGAVLLGSLLVVALARLLNPGWVRSGPAVAFAPLMVGLLAAQLLIFVFQETVELALVGRLPSLHLLAYGVAGQAPVALLAAVALRWLSQRLAPALRALVALRPTRPARFPALPASTGFRPIPVFVSRRHGAAHRLRGPPSLPTA